MTIIVRCQNTTVEFESTLAEKVGQIGFTLTSEIQFVVNSVLVAFGCPDCRILCDDSFALLIRQQTPSGSSSYSPSQTSGTQGTASLAEDHLAACPSGTTLASPKLPATRSITETGHRRFLKGPTKVSWADDIESSPRDVSIGLGGGQTTEGNGIGDSNHASLGPQEEDKVALVGNGTLSMDYGSMPPLPSTLAETVCVSPSSPHDMPGVVSTLTTAEVDMLEGLEEMEYGQVVPAIGSEDGDAMDMAMQLRRSCTMEHNEMGDGIYASSFSPLAEGCPYSSSDKYVPIVEQTMNIDRKGKYLRFTEVGLDMAFDKSVLNNLDHTVHALGNHVDRLESRICELEDERDTAIRAAGQHQATGSRRRVKTPAPAALTASTPLVSTVPALAPAVGTSRPPPAAVLAAKTRHATLGQLALPNKPVIPIQPIVTPQTSDIPLLPTNPSFAMAASAAAGEKEFTLVQRCRLKSPPPIQHVTKREHHVTVRFDSRESKVCLPTGVNTEMIKNALNKVLVSSASHARFASCIQHPISGDLLLCLAQHSSTAVWGFVAAMDCTLMELKLHSFTFCQDTKKIKVLASNIPFSPSGVGTTWEVEDWQGDSACDDLLRDIELSNPGIHIVGRPHWVGSLAGHKSHQHSSGSVVLTVELSPGVKSAVDCSSVMIYSRRRPLHVWVEIKSNSICHHCLGIGHVAVMCRAPAACKYCEGNHISTEHTCLIRGCPAGKGSLCSHVKLECRLCTGVGHVTGDPACPDIRRPSRASSTSSTSSDKGLSEETTIAEITDQSAQKLTKSAQSKSVDKENAKTAVLTASSLKATGSHSNS
ncbi:unnamed protein product [Tuber aestivum]|uniref:Uncharacterized protein n=1 Tax=Tuber aestivum TaxID=59557 RepID=A0A292Q8F3_9PEZI|nr:unnamed protein product [Tuber aestivum]